MLSVRVDEELKERMRQLPGVNWSKFIRENIEHRIREEEMRQAVQLMDGISEKTDPDWSGSEEVPKWRER